MLSDRNTKAIPIKIRNEKKDMVIKDYVVCNDCIGPYGTPNTYTANLPESIRKDYIKLDPSQRRAYMDPNHSYV